MWGFLQIHLQKMFLFLEGLSLTNVGSNLPSIDILRLSHLTFENLFETKNLIFYMNSVSSFVTKQEIR